jgi:hypothetical protein
MINAKNLNQAFDDSKITYLNRADALGAFKVEHEISEDENGVLTTTYDGVTASLSDALVKFGLDRRELVDGRSLPRDGVVGRPVPLTSRADLKTIKGKSEYITSFGLAAYEALPRFSEPTSELKTREQWKLLSSKEKSRLIGLDPNVFAKLSSTPNPDRAGKAYTNTAALAKLASIRPGKK